MKGLILFTIMAFSVGASALEVVSAKLDSSGENLVVSVRHGGGCGTHDYKLVIQGCAESMPLQCFATIKHTTNDFCEAIIGGEAKFNLKEYGLNDSYYNNASLTIKGDVNSSVVVNLTKKASGSTFPEIRCLTHTGSILEIADNNVKLTTTNNETVNYTVVDKDLTVFETMPSTYASVYKLNDGRSIETSFRAGSKNGKGNFVREDGSRSPEFKCVSK